MGGFVGNVANGISSAVRGVKYVVDFPRNVLRINGLIKKPSYYPELERKSKFQMWMDNFKWLLRRKEFNKFYISYGMDVKGFRDSDAYLANNEFILLRNRGNHHPADYGDYNYIALLRDKYLFSSYLSAAIGAEAVVPTVALITKGSAFVPASNTWEKVDTLLTENSRLVYKVIDGECADGVMLVEVSGDQVLADDKILSKQEFVESLGGRKYIVQDVVKQHSALQVFKTRSVNTIRAVTMMGKSGAVHVFAAFLRLGASADSFVDNRAVGGLGVGIDLDSGKLMKYGFPHDAFGVKLEEHLLSGVRFEGFQIPYWQETVELITNAHKQFYEIQSIGWDVIITENGPVLLEGNDNWEIGGPQDTYGGLKAKWFELVNS